MKIVSKSVAETENFARDYMAKLILNTRGATLIGLYGELGSGKTTFTQSVGRILGVTDAILSPTFVIMKRFPIESFGHKNLIHIDVYRLQSAQELLRLGWKEIVADSNNLILLEWPERVKEVLPDHKKIFFTFIDEQTREIETKE